MLIQIFRRFRRRKNPYIPIYSLCTEVLRKSFLKSCEHYTCQILLYVNCLGVFCRLSASLKIWKTFHKLYIRKSSLFISFWRTNFPKILEKTEQTRSESGAKNLFAPLRSDKTFAPLLAPLRSELQNTGLNPCTAPLVPFQLQGPLKFFCMDDSPQGPNLDFLHGTLRI